MAIIVFRDKLEEEAARIVSRLEFIIDLEHLYAFASDPGICQNMINYNLGIVEIQNLKNKNISLYLSVLGSRLLGAGVYTMLCAQKYNIVQKNNMFSNQELYEMLRELTLNDTYELAIRELKIGKTSKEKKKIDSAVILIQEAALKLDTGLNNNEQHIREYMSVMFDAGVTVAVSYITKEYYSNR